MQRVSPETGQPVVVTQNGRPTGVLVSPTEYEERERFLESVAAGVAVKVAANISVRFLSAVRP